MSDSSPSSSSPQNPLPPLKRKREAEAPTVANDSDSDASESEHDSDSDSSDSSVAPDVSYDGDIEDTLKAPLSHAEKRRLKRKELGQTGTAVKDITAPASKKPKLQKDVAANTGKRQNSVWVGNLAFKTTAVHLKEFFDGVGEITRIHMPLKASSGPGLKGDNRGFAYVDFATPEAKIAAIALSETHLIGRKLLIKDGDDFTGRPALPGTDVAAGGDTAKTTPGITHSKTAQKILRAQKQPPAPTLFLGNLGFETTDASIRELFEAHRVVAKKGKPEEGAEEAGDAKMPKDVWIRKIRMGTFEDTGACKGFAFVDFTTIEHATAALVNPKNHHLNGRALVVEYASAEAVRRGAPKTKRDGEAAPQRRREGKSRRPGKEERSRNVPSKSQEDKVGEDSQPATSYNVKQEERTHTGGAKPGPGSIRTTKGPRVRPKPGAALALAKRESAAILPSQGRKIVF